MASIEPVTSTVAGVLLYGEVLSPANLAGVVLVLAGVVLGSLPERSRP
jgi:probable blue pigment (indigoidine) exporter